MAIAIQRVPDLSSAEKLQNHYLGKHNSEQTTPLKILAVGIALIYAVALVIFSSYTVAIAAAYGLGIFTVTIGALLLLVNRTPSINKKASEALKTPGFYEFAKRTPRHICSAEAIVQAHSDWSR